MGDEIIIAAADSLLGQLQRGRGAGWLAARRQKREDVWPLLLECITHDPRLDSQVENRDEFYASLIIETQMDLQALATHLREHDDRDQTGWNTPLTIGTLGALAKRNYRNAVDILRDYVAWGNWWNWGALDALVKTGNSATWVDLDEVLCKRFDSDEALKAELGWFFADAEPWKTWGEQNDRVRMLVGALRQPAEALPASDLNGRSIAEILQMAANNERVQGGFRPAIENKVRRDDYAFLISQVNITEPRRSTLALMGLAKLANPAMFDWLLDFWSNHPKMRGGLRGQAAAAMSALPPDLTLPLARKWLSHDDWHFRRLAEHLMEDHARLEDVPRLRQEIVVALADDYEHCYRLCSLISAFDHLQGIGRIPELETTFCEFRYSYGRTLAAEAMLATDRDFFVRSYAQECLWDCEDRTRALGCETADLANPVANERIKQLAADAWEDEAVRAAAAKAVTPV